MKAGLTFNLGNSRMLLAVGSLFDIDSMCVQQFQDTNDVRNDERYVDKIQEALDNYPNRNGLRQRNGSINVVLLDGNNQPMYTRNDDGVRIERRVKVMYNSGISTSISDILTSYYQCHPEKFARLLRNLHMKLQDEYKAVGLSNITFMNYEHFRNVQIDMYGNDISLFGNNPIHIENHTSFNDNVSELIHSLDFNQLPDIYFGLRKTIISDLEQQKKDIKAGLYEPLSEYEITRIKIFGYNSSVPKDKQDSTIDSYLKLQKEVQEFKEIDDLNDKSYEKKRNGNKPF